MPLPRAVPSVSSEINVTPLVDVMLVLLIIFMVVTPMLQNGVPINLPPSHNPVNLPDEEKEDAVVVAVSHDGHVFLKNKLISPDELTDRVKDLLTNKLDKTVYIRADARARYKTVADTVDAVRAAGVDNVAMLTEKVDKYGHIISGPAESGGQ